jgi:putative ABC transport system permease protein
MRLVRQLQRGVRALINPSAVERDIGDEVHHYLDEAAAAHRARGLSETEALRAARLELGNVTTVSEQVRESGWENAAETIIADVRYALRRLRAAPIFTATATLTLALGLGATTAIFSVVSPILIEPLPYPDANRIATIAEFGSDGSRNAGTFGMYREFAARARAFDAVATFKVWQPTLTGPEQPERLDGQRVGASYFRVLGIPPALGRDFEPADDRANGPNVIILSDALWHRRFGGDRAIIGRQVTLDDNASQLTSHGNGYVVIGVMPSGFESVLAPSAQLWAPLQYDIAQGRAWGHHLRTVGRLQPGVSIDRASRDVDAIGRAVIAEQHPETYDPATRFIATRLQDDVTRSVKPALLAIIGAVMLVLVIAAVNVTNLLLARGAQRRAEFALRTALGAQRGRLIRQLLTESLLLAAIGGALGMLVAALGVRALVALSPPELPRIGSIGIDGAVFAFALGLTTLVGLAFGLTPALQAARNGPHHDLQQGTRRTVGGRERIRALLVVAEVALALVLLVGSGLLLRSIERLFAVSVGFDSSRVLTMQVQESGQRFAADDARIRFFEDALESVRRVPGVTAAAFTSLLPLSGDLDEYGAHFEAGPERPARSYSVFRYAVSPGYLETMRIPLRRGRLLDERDRADAPRVALISESLARVALPGIDPVGQRLRIGPNDGMPFTIVGVVGDVKQLSLALSQSDAVYITPTQWHWADNVMSLVVRTRDGGNALTPVVREAVWSVDKDQPIVRVASMDDLLAASAASRRFALTLFEAFALAALVLAAAGIYGVLAGSVAERTREIGVRAALGASRTDIVSLVVGQGMRLTALGIVLGLAAATVATQALVTLLFGISRLDPVTYSGVIVLLVLTAAVACAVPAWRASRVDPATTLRTE